MAAVQVAPNRLSRRRLNSLLALCCLFSTLCAGKLVDVQVTRHAELSAMAAREIEKEYTLLPRRGTIRDRDGRVLAMNVDHDSLYVTPAHIQQPEKLALTLAPLLNMPVEDVLAGLTAPKVYLRLARWLSPEAAERIRSLEEPGLVLEPEPKRVYPLGSFAAHIVGVANWEGVGIAGVEAFNDELLTGITGTLRAEWDAASRPIAIGPRYVQLPRDGADLTLTIDPFVQKLVEEELRKGIEENNASGGSIVVMDPDTGEVLGMASWPPFDPNRYLDYPAEVYNRNAAITDLYEPGSTFKMVNLAIGMDAGAFGPHSAVEDTGTVQRYGYAISNWNAAPNGPIGPDKVLYYSSNVGALQFAELTGAEAFYAGVRRFGYGEPTGVDLSGEQAGIVQWPDYAGWSPLTLDTNGFGQGISVTPLQHLRAISAIANGGFVMEPHVVKAWCQGDACHEVGARTVRRAVSQQTTDLLRPMLTASANTYAQVVWGQRCGYVDVPLVPGYNIAAKTGTSQIPNGRGGYEDSATIGSVAGFAPAEDPRVAVLVKIDRPKDLYGVITAIPIYQTVMARLMTYLRLPPDPALVAECQRSGAGGQ